LDFARNVILNNTGIQLNNLTPSDSGVIEAKDCFWGTQDLMKIAKGIRDGKDDPAFSIVKIDPVARTAAETQAGKEPSE
jgi:hypothetical protein